MNFRESLIAAPTEGFTVKSHFKSEDAVVRQIYDRKLKSAGKFGPASE